MEVFWIPNATSKNTTGGWGWTKNPWSYPRDPNVNPFENCFMIENSGQMGAAFDQVCSLTVTNVSYQGVNLPTPVGLLVPRMTFRDSSKMVWLLGCSVMPWRHDMNSWFFRMFEVLQKLVRLVSCELSLPRKSIMISQELSVWLNVR